MKIETHENWYEEKPTVTITLDKKEDAWEIAECVKAQYPNTKAVIRCVWKDEDGMHIGILIVGINLKELEK